MNLLFNLAVADSYGFSFEYAPHRYIQQNNRAEYYVKHHKYRIKPGCYSDDTQMTLAIAEALIEDDPWTPESLSERFVNVFKRDPRTGYAGRFYGFLKEIKDGEEFLRRIIPTSDKSGGAMRTTPLGLLPDMDDALRKTEIQAAITHNTTNGIEAAKAATLLVYYAHKDKGRVEDAGEWIQEQLNGRKDCQWDKPYSKKIGSKGWMSVRAAITAFSNNKNLKHLLQDCVDFTGDVDTVATIAVAAASVSEDYEKTIPYELKIGLENKKYGADYLIELDKKLTKKYG